MSADDGWTVWHTYQALECLASRLMSGSTRRLQFDESPRAYPQKAGPGSLPDQSMNLKEIYRDIFHNMEAEEYEEALNLCSTILRSKQDGMVALYYSALASAGLSRMDNAVRYMEATGLAPGPDAEAFSIGKYKKFAIDFLTQQNAAIQRGVPSILVVSLPKSASAYVQTALVRIFDIPWARMSLSSPTPLKSPNGDGRLFARARVITSWAAWIARGGATIHEHFAPLPENLDALSRAGVKRLVVHLRDPRQATLSYIHHVRKSSIEKGIHTFISYKSSLYDHSEIGDAEIDKWLDEVFPKMVEWMNGWFQASVDPNLDISIYFVSFEEMIDDKPKYFLNILNTFGIHEFDDNMADVLASGHRGEIPFDPTDTHRNYRSGSKDEWRRVFSDEQKEMAWKAMPKPLCERFGWAP